MIKSGICILFILIVLLCSCDKSEKNDNNIIKVDLVPIIYSDLSPDFEPDPSLQNISSRYLELYERGLISNEPLEPLKDLPKDIDIQYFGLFSLCAPNADMIWAKYILSQNLSNGPTIQNIKDMYSDYNWDLSYDSEISFWVGKNKRGEFLVGFDTNNDEKFSNEEIQLFQCIDLDTTFKKLVIQQSEKERIDFYFVDTTVEFEYPENNRIRKSKVEIALLYPSIKDKTEEKVFTNPDNFIGEIRQMRKGTLTVNDIDYNIIISPYKIYRYATFHKPWVSVFIDVNKDGIWEYQSFNGERFKANETIHLENASLSVKEIDILGRHIVFEKIQKKGKPVKRIAKGKRAPDFEAMDMNNQRVTLKDYRGKYLILNFWYTGCPPCIAEMPGLNKLVKKYKNRNIEFLALTFNDITTVNKFLENHPFSYRIIPNSSHIDSLYNIHGHPVHIIINPEGIIDFIDTGGGPDRYKELDIVISRLIKTGK